MLTPIDAPLVITSPPAGAAPSRWDPIDCVAGLSAPLRNANERLAGVEWSVNGEPAGHGRLVTVGPLTPDKHEITATLPASDETLATKVTVVVQVQGPRRGKGYDGPEQAD